MLITVGEFTRRVKEDVDVLINDLQHETGRLGSEEEESWRKSFPAVLPALENLADPDIQIHFDSSRSLAVEYRLPASFSFADMVLLGRHHDHPSAVFIELKHWATRADSPGDFPGLIRRRGGVHLHPSDQVKGYAEYCRRFHSAVLEANARVHGCVWFTRDVQYNAYLRPPNKDLTTAYPCFSVTGEDLQTRIPTFLNDHLSRPDQDFADSFERGRYLQDRSFVKAVAGQILNPASSPFVLLDNQRFAFNRCWELVRSHVFDQRATGRRVIIIEGPPGSGKSVIAARLWASLVSHPRLGKGNVVLATTSTAQNTSWAYLFESVSGTKAARGAIRKTNAYMPISTHEYGRFDKKYPGSFGGPNRWRDNLRLLRNLGSPFQVEDQEMLITIVDEAHALINPEHTVGRGQFGFAPNLGPQAYHLMRGSTISIFLLDSRQNFRERENTAVEDLRKWARELDADAPDAISLEGAQFRCNGSKEYVDWVEGLLDARPARGLASLASGWRVGFPTSMDPHGSRAVAEDRTPFGGSQSTRTGRFEFKIMDSPFVLEELLKSKVQRGHTVRMLASYATEWKTKGLQNPHELPDQLKDFQIPVSASYGPASWTRVWNVVQNGDYSGFTQAAPGTRMANDPLCEVGCPYSVRGFDFDYIGLLWFPDLVWRKGEWCVQPEHVHETGLLNLTRRARRERDPSGPDRLQLLGRVKQAYRILLTRALRGLYVWAEDSETRGHLSHCLEP